MLIDTYMLSYTAICVCVYLRVHVCVCVCVSVCPAHSTEYGVIAVFPSGVAHLLSHCSQEEDRSTEDQEKESKQEHESHSTA